MANKLINTVLSRRKMIGGLALLVGGAFVEHEFGILEKLLKPLNYWHSKYVFENNKDIIVEVAAKDDLDKESSFLEYIANQLGVEYHKIDPEKDKGSLYAFKDHFGVDEKGIYFVSEGKIKKRSGLTQSEIEQAALEYTIDMLEGTNSVLILSAIWCELCKISRDYLKKLLKEFPEYKLVYFVPNSKTPKELEHLDNFVYDRYGSSYGPPTIIYFGENVIISAGINSKDLNFSVVTGEGNTVIFYNQDLIESPNLVNDNFKSDKYKGVPVHVILEQNRRKKF